MKRPLKRCANGCDKPPKPPSLVICEDCLGVIGRRFKRLAAGEKDWDREPIGPQQGGTDGPSR